MRPDTIYADERYANITQAEINEAKARIAKKNEGKKVDMELKKHAPHDFIHVDVKKEPLIYPWLKL